MATSTVLTAAGKELKEYLKPCIDLSERLDRIDEELSYYEGLELTREEEDLREERRQVYSLLCQYRNEVYDLIRDTPELSVDERSVIRLRYLRAVKWSDVALTKYLTKSAVYKQHRKALNKMAKTRNT